jgi:hypothetical protein
MTPRVRFLTVPLLAVVLAACQFGPQDTRPVPSVRQIGSDLKCASGDHGYEDQVGWGFCYPGTWQYVLRSQSNNVPIPELDLIFDVTNVPCTTPSPIPGEGSPRPVCGTGAGLFGVIIVSTYTRNNASNLAAWIQANLLASPTPSGSPSPSPSSSPSPSPSPIIQTIAWGNAQEAGLLPDGRRIALTPQQVVILTLHPGNLDLESAMSTRLGTWKFTV